MAGDEQSDWEPVAEFQASGLRVRVEPSMNVVLVFGHGEHEQFHLVSDIEGLRTALGAAKAVRDKRERDG